MAQKIVRDSGLPIFVKQAPCLEATVVNDVIVSGAIVGFAGINARAGEDGLFYTSVDTAAEVRFDAFSGAVTQGQRVYLTSGNVPTLTATANRAIGYATRAKGAASGKLFVQLVPGAAIAAVA